MPYCPKCDMEFVTGITRCTDCGGELAESKETYRDYGRAEGRMELEGGAGSIHQAPPGPEAADTALPPISDAPSPRAEATVYIRKAQRYEDLKSSVWAFALVGAAFFSASLLAWLGVIHIPIGGPSRLMMQGVMTALGIGCLSVAAITARSARGMAGQAEAEEKSTSALIQWFTGRYRPEDIDRELGAGASGMQPEELALKRFEVIQDLLTTQRDLPDQAYAEMLCEEIYSRLFEGRG